MTDVPPLDPVRFTRQLCEIESTTYNEGAIGDFLEGFLNGRGWTVEKTPVPQPLESENTSARWNIYAGREGQTPDLVFSTHMDTVPPYIPCSEDREFMYGRGVCDAKGIIAAQVAAAEALRASGFRVGLLFVSEKSGIQRAPRLPILRRREAASSSMASRLTIAWGWPRKVHCAQFSRPPARWPTPPIPSSAIVRFTSWWRFSASCLSSLFPWSTTSVRAR